MSLPTTSQRNMVHCLSVALIGDSARENYKSSVHKMVNHYHPYKMTKVQHLRITDSQCESLSKFCSMTSCHTKVILKYYKIFYGQMNVSS